MQVAVLSEKCAPHEESLLHPVAAIGAYAQGVMAAYVRENPLIQQKRWVYIISLAIFYCSAWVNILGAMHVW